MSVVARYPKEGPAFATIYSLRYRDKTRYRLRWSTTEGKKEKTFSDLDTAKATAEELCEKAGGKHPRPHYISAADKVLLDKAKRIGEAALDDLIDRRGKIKGRATISDLTPKFLEFYQHRAKCTRDDMKAKIKTIAATFGPRWIDSITTEEIETWYLALPGAPRTKNNHLRALTILLNQAKRWDYLPPDRDVASARVRRLKIPATDPAIITPAQAEPILREASLPVLRYLALGMFAGLRPSEAAGVGGERDGLLWSDIDFDAQTIRIRRAVAGKTGRPRVIDLRDTLASWLAPQQPEQDRPVCYRTSHKKLWEENRDHQWIIPWPKDSARHSFISYLLAENRDIAETAHQAGNTPGIIEQHYHNPRTREESAAWFALTPEKIGRTL